MPFPRQFQGKARILMNKKFEDLPFPSSKERKAKAPGNCLAPKNCMAIPLISMNKERIYLFPPGKSPNKSDQLITIPDFLIIFNY